MLVVNTCAFIDSAKQESIDTILEMAQHKKDGACQRLIVTGCLAERYRDELKTEIPEIDAVLGTGEVPDIVGAIGQAGERHASRTAAPLRVLSPSTLDRSCRTRTSPNPHPSPDAAPTYIYDADTPRLLATPKHYAYLKIAEGCDYKCAFCIIPTLRGDYRSRPAESIVREARAPGGARRQGAAAHLAGHDVLRHRSTRTRRARATAARAERRSTASSGSACSTSIPTTIDDDTLAAMAECDKVCKYIDLPLQHASNAVLKRMKRPGTRQSYDRLLDAHPRTRPRCRAPHHVYRRVSRAKPDAGCG